MATVIGRVRAWELARDAAQPLKVSRLVRPRFTGAMLEAQQEGRNVGLRMVVERVVDLEADEAYVVQVLAVDGDDRLLAELVGGFEPDGPPPVWGLATLLEGGRGVLTTSAHHPMPLAARELAQTLPGADLATLLPAHHAALDLLAARGVRPGSVSASTVVDVSATVHELLGEPARRSARETARHLRDNLKAGRHEGLGPLGTQADLDARIAAVRTV